MRRLTRFKFKRPSTVATPNSFFAENNSLNRKRRFRSFLSGAALALLFAVPLAAAASEPAPVSPETIVLTNVTIIDGSGTKPKSRMTIVISGGRIAEIFNSGGKKLPAGAAVVDLSGHYVIPGLIDSHYHFMPGKWTGEEGKARRRFAFYGGVTSARDMAGDALALAELAKEVEGADVPSPRVYFSALMAGPEWFSDPRVVEISHGRAAGEAPWARSVTPETDMVKAVSEAKATGAIAIKIYSDLAPELVAKITREAHRQGLKVWSHAAIFPSRPSDALAAGVDSISHSHLLILEDANVMAEVNKDRNRTSRRINWAGAPPASKQITDLLRRMQRQGTTLDATLHLYNENIIEQLAIEESKRSTNYLQLADWAYSVTKLAHRMGVTILAGTDLPERPRRREIANIHLEMELLVDKAGMTPLEAIKAATRNGALALGVEKSFGTVARGKVADLVVLAADPTADIRNTRKIAYVIKGGKLHKPEKVVMPD